MRCNNRTSAGWMSVLAAGALALGGCQTSQSTSTANARWTHYGPTDSPGGTAMQVSQIKGNEREIIVEGEAVKMCTTSGCWVVIRDDAGTELFVTCEDEGFHLPTNTVGHRVMAHGDSAVEVKSVQELKHYAQVSGASKEEIARITEAERTISLVAHSVYIRGNDLDRALTPEQAEAACEAAQAQN